MKLFKNLFIWQLLIKKLRKDRKSLFPLTVRLLHSFNWLEARRLSESNVKFYFFVNKSKVQQKKTNLIDKLITLFTNIYGSSTDVIELNHGHILTLVLARDLKQTHEQKLDCCFTALSPLKGALNISWILPVQKGSFKIFRKHLNENQIIWKIQEIIKT